jgi:uncharacterized protein YdgA (DUF945 family)
MKKLVFSFLLFGLAGLGGFALWAGMSAQGHYRDWVHSLGERGDLRVLETSFERGWMSSHAETKLELHGRSGDAFKVVLELLGAEDIRARIGFRMSHQIEHGPLPLWQWAATGFRGAPVVAEVASVIELDHESQAELVAVMGRMPSIAAHTVVRSSGAGETRFSAPSQELESVTDAGPRAVAWKGMRGSLSFAPGWGSFAGTVRSPGFDAEGPALLLSATGMEWHLDVAASAGLPLGRSSWRVGSLRIEPVGDGTEVAEVPEAGPEPDPEEPAVAEQGPDSPVADAGAATEEPEPAQAADPFALVFSGLAIGQSSQVGAGRFAGEAWIEVQRVDVGTASYGPGEVRIALSDVDADALLKLRRTTSRLEAQAEGGQVSGEAASAAVAGEMLELMPELLALSPRLELSSLALGLPSGNLRGSGALWFDSVDGSPPTNVLDVMAGLGGKLDVEAPALAVDTFFASLPGVTEEADSGAELGDLRKRGLVIRDGGVYRTRARWHNGQITINGLPFETVFPDEREEGGDPAPEADAPPEASPPSMAQLFSMLSQTR